MITVHTHAKLIAAFLGDDEPCYGECQCATCRAWPLNGQPAGLDPIRRMGQPEPAAYFTALSTAIFS